MKPVHIKEMNTEFAKDQDENLTLPAHRSEDGVITSCWQMSFMERIKVVLTGKIFLQTMTFGRMLQPQKVMVDNPLISEE